LEDFLSFIAKYYTLLDMIFFVKQLVKIRHGL